MKTLTPTLQSPLHAGRQSTPSQQALAILAVDNIHPSPAGVALMQSIEAGSMTRVQAIQCIVERARRYANQTP